MKARRICSHSGFQLGVLWLSFGLIGLWFDAIPVRGDEIETFNAFLLPSISCVWPGDEVSIDYLVDSTAHQFNGYEITIAYDPAIVAFLGVDEGPLMVEACFNTFANLTTTDSTLTFVHVILCGGMSLDGPGVLSRYRFQALGPGISPLQILTDPDQAFYDAGLYVAPSHPTRPRQVILHDASIVVFDPAASVGGDRSGSDQLSLRVLSNPSRVGSPIEFTLESPSTDPVWIDLTGVDGRRLWSGWGGALGPGIRRERVPASAGARILTVPGVVYLRVKVGDLEVRRRIVRVR